jgi:hypothetical protein
MLNLRVRDLDAMVAQLRAAGVEVTPDPQAYPNGRFAITADPGEQRAVAARCRDLDEDAFGLGHQHLVVRL